MQKELGTLKIGTRNGVKQKQIISFLVLSALLLGCLLVSFNSCKSDNTSESDEFDMLVHAFTRFVDDASDFSFNSIERYTAGNDCEYYYFTMNMTNNVGTFDTSGLIRYDKFGEYLFVHSSNMNGISNREVVNVFNELKSSGKGQVLTDREIQDVTERIKELQNARLFESNS